MMGDNDRVAWSQHYDSVQWTSISVFTTGVGALLGYALTRSSSEFNLGLGLLGFWITNLTVYFTAGFREFRRDLHLAMTDRDLAAFITDREGRRRFAMWRAYLLTFAVLDFLWLSYFWKHGHHALAALLAIGSTAFLLYARHQGRSVTFKAWCDAHPDSGWHKDEPPRLKRRR